MDANRELESTKTECCTYVSPSGARCERAVRAGSIMCDWHDPEHQKDRDSVKEQMEMLGKMGQSMEGFALRRINLSDIHLESGPGHNKVNLRYADLYRANLQKSHLYEADLSHANLMKADLSYANLHWVNLEGANLLGTKLTKAKIEHVHWGKTLLQEQQAVEAYKKRNYSEARTLFEEAEEIYRHLFRECEGRGLYNEAGIFFRRGMIMRRKQLPKYSFRRLTSIIVDYCCGYGELPWRVLGFCSFVIIGSALLYGLFGIQVSDSVNRVTLSWAYAETARETLDVFLNCLYFSFVTFTTLGFGDLVPLGFSKLVSVLEAMLGAFVMALFVVVFVKKMTR